MKSKFNPFSFTAGPVVVICTAVYAAVIALLLVQSFTLPEPEEIPGMDLNEAWHDLQNLTAGFHPYNSRLNDEVRVWLLQRVHELSGKSAPAAQVDDMFHLDLPDQPKLQQVDDIIYLDLPGRPKVQQRSQQASGRMIQRTSVTIFADDTSNVTFGKPENWRRAAYSTYFESTNIIVYIHGRNDDGSEWWHKPDGEPSQRNCVLVNAHYDSVSTGFGATDDGVGIVTILQLIKYFTAAGNQPRNGIIALLNNGEEDGLHGAHTFLKHPMSKLVATFLNLEGAGAGGRATLFRSTDAQVTRAYQAAPHPFGTVTSADAFKRGAIKSDTDYSVFEPAGFRGLDVAFFEPRARYHTIEDDTRHTNLASVHHMLSGSLATMKYLTDNSESILSDDGGQWTVGVWFDLFGRAFPVFRLHTLFALSVTLAVVAPLAIIVTMVFLARSDRQYIFSGAVKPDEDTEPDTAVSIKGKRGILRGPLALIFSIAVVLIGGALVNRINPFIVYSSPFAVWSMLAAGWLVMSYCVLAFADWLRPTVLQRLYASLWIFVVGWIILIVSIVLQQRAELAGTYLIFFYFASIFLATQVCLLEVFGTAKRSEYVAEQLDARRPASTADDPRQSIDSAAEDADENSPLIRGGRKRTFKRRRRSGQQSIDDTDDADDDTAHVTGELEQAWASSMPTSLWVVQFLLIAAFPLIIMGQQALLLTAALAQTLADGNDPRLVYAAFALLTMLIFIPLGPFLHRFSYHVPALLFCVCIGTLLYNLFAFPFSPNNRLKILFQQRIDLDTGANNASLIGVESGTFLHEVVHSIPSAALHSEQIHCEPRARRPGISECKYPGPPPRPVFSSPTPDDPSSWFSHSFSYDPSPDSTAPFRAEFNISVHDSKACKILFDQAITDFEVVSTSSGAVQDPRDSESVKVASAEAGSAELRLWTRSMSGSWSGWVEWSSSNLFGQDAPPPEANHDTSSAEGEHEEEERELRARHHTSSSSSSSSPPRGHGKRVFTGQVVCLWSDANPSTFSSSASDPSGFASGAIPALKEVWHYAPVWAVVSKVDDGLVEGFKRFRIEA